MSFESGGVPKDWRSAVVVPLYKNKKERTECRNYRGISLLSVVAKIYSGILVYRVLGVTEGVIDDDRGSFKARSQTKPLIGSSPPPLRYNQVLICTGK